MSLKSSRIDSLRVFQTHRSTANLVEVEVALESLSTIVDVSLGAVSSDQTTVCSESGSSTNVDDLNKIIDLLNPINEDGKIILITRFGQDNVDKYLPNIIRSINNEGKSVIWSCDPMHGNTIKSKSGKKTRIFDSIINEVKINFQIHKVVVT